MRLSLGAGVTSRVRRFPELSCKPETFSIGGELMRRTEWACPGVPGVCTRGLALGAATAASGLMGSDGPSAQAAGGHVTPVPAPEAFLPTRPVAQRVGQNSKCGICGPPNAHPTEHRASWKWVE